MKNVDKNPIIWTACPKCHGRGKKRQRLRKSLRLHYQNQLEAFKKTNGEGNPPVRTKGHLQPCAHCSGSGLVMTSTPNIPDTAQYPNVAIIGGGLGGVALAVACLHRKIPFTLYERDSNFDARSQGYGLTLQQASKAIAAFGVDLLGEGVISTRHIVHTTDGKVIGEWGMRKWMQGAKKSPRYTNVHIARQSLRLALLEQLGGKDAVQWNHQLVDFKQSEGESIQLNFEVEGKLKNTTADLVVGADGIRSAIRKLLLGEHITPLRHLDCMVILGICPLSALEGIESPLLDRSTVFQTANGHERIYMMPYSDDAVMWQLSFPMREEDAKALSARGAAALKAEACRRTQWHHPIPQILAATIDAQVSGYPVYDRELLKPEMFSTAGQVTLIGDAAHPMSPFKGQGANQALLDALSLARAISKECKPLSQWRDAGIRKSVLTKFESEMLERSAIKVKDSAAAAAFLHSEIVLREEDAPRGRSVKTKEA